MKTLFAFIFLGFSATVACAQLPDMVLYNGNIFTSDSAKLYVQALAVKKGIVLQTGTNKEILKLAGNSTRKINLGGKTVVPGFNDAHDHPGLFMTYGKSYSYQERQVGGPSPAAVIDSVSQIVKKSTPGEWISGTIGQLILSDMSFREKLDDITPDNPVILFAWWGHGMVFNSKALKLAGISDEDKDPIGGWYERNPVSGGINTLKEFAGWNAAETYYASIPDSIKVKGLRDYTNLQVQLGITTTQFMTNFAMASAILKENPPIRTRIVPIVRTNSTSRDLGIWAKFSKNQCPLVYISGIKYIIDGTPFDESSLSSKPYATRPGWFGRFDFAPDTIRQILKEGLSGKDQLIMHVVGDSALNTVLAMMNKTASHSTWQKLRVRIEHNVGYSSNIEEQKNAIKSLNLLMMHTPMYARKSPFRSLIRKGIKVGISPDGLTNPYVNIMIVTSQQTNPDENVTREEAVIAYTKNNAYAEFTDNIKGTLTKGKLADLAVLSQNIFTVPISKLPETKSLLTMVGGKIIYSDKEMDNALISK